MTHHEPGVLASPRFEPCVTAMRRPLTAAYYGQSGYHNYGYWIRETKTQHEASENLMKRLLAFLPEKDGKILDVTCGLGGSTRYLLRHCPPASIVAINLSQAQLDCARVNAPGCSFQRMDAVTATSRMAVSTPCSVSNQPSTSTRQLPRRSPALSKAAGRDRLS